MNLNQNKNKEAIILIITSFNQLYNFLSYFLQNKLIRNKKIYLTIFSDNIPEELIKQFKQYIEKFVSVEVINLKRKSINAKVNFLQFRFLNFLFYYFFVIKKMFQAKKLKIIPIISISGRMQIPVLFFMIFFSSSKIFFLEDGVGEYVPYANFEKKHFFFFILKKFLKLNKSRIYILQLSKQRSAYRRILNQPFLNKSHIINNRKLYENFIKNSFQKKLIFKPKCIIIGTNTSLHNINYYENLYIETLKRISKKYSYNRKQILFFFHPRIKSIHRKRLVKSLSSFSNIQPISTIIVENYLHQKNVEIVVGSLSSALYYAKTIFNKKNVYHLNDNSSFHYDNFLKVFKSVGIKSFF